MLSNMKYKSQRLVSGQAPLLAVANQHLAKYLSYHLLYLEDGCNGTFRSVRIR